jgi:hypothetical protein
MAAQNRVSRSPLGFPGSATRVLESVRDRAIASDGASRASGTRFWPTLLLVALCQIADLITFSFAVAEHGPQGELGPLGLVYRAGGFWAVALVKLGIVGIVLAILSRYPWQRMATRRHVALIVAIIGVFGAFTNVFAFV